MGAWLSRNGVVGNSSCLVGSCLSTNPQGQSEVLVERIRKLAYRQQVQRFV